MATAAMALEFCSDCGREWPSKFGRHGCNYHRAYVHNNSLVFEPRMALPDALSLLLSRYEREATRSAESADLAGEPSAYPHYLAEIDRAIGQLKRFRQEMQELAGHVHDWNDDDYCSICGADGRA